MSDVAFAAGFASIRQFNDTVRTVFGTSPTELRSRVARAGRAATPVPVSTSLSLRLPFRRPLCPDNLFGHLAATAVPGVEEVRAGWYRRTLRLGHGPGIVELSPTPDHVACNLVLSDLRDLTTAIARCRWLLDLDADPEAIDERLAADRALAPLVAKAPGRRVPRCVDGEELAVRAVLGQQVSTAAASRIAGRLAAQFGEEVPDSRGGLSRLFPVPAALRGVRDQLPGGRRRSLVALATALDEGSLEVGPGCNRTEAHAVLDALPGVGPWTAQTIAMRALGDPDAFPVTDLGVRRGADSLGLPRGKAFTAHAERWRPWRAYAVQYLWATGDHPINHWPPTGDDRGRYRQNPRSKRSNRAA